MVTQPDNTGIPDGLKTRGTAIYRSGYGYVSSGISSSLSQSWLHIILGSLHNSAVRWIGRTSRNPPLRISPASVILILSRDRRLPFCQASADRDFRIVISRYSTRSELWRIDVLDCRCTSLCQFCRCITAANMIHFSVKSHLPRGVHVVHRGATVGGLQCQRDT